MHETLDELLENAHRGLISIARDDTHGWTVGEGYDSWPEMDEWTQTDKLQLADIMIERWTQWRNENA